MLELSQLHREALEQRHGAPPQRGAHERQGERRARDPRPQGRRAARWRRRALLGRPRQCFAQQRAHLPGDALGLGVDAGDQRAAQLREMLAQRAVGEGLEGQGGARFRRHPSDARGRWRETRLLGGAMLGDQVQLVQHLGYVGRLDLLRQHAHRAERAHLTQIQLALLGGVHHDGDGGGARVALDGLHGLQAVHARHEVIHEDHVRVVAAQVLDGRLGALRGIDVDVVLLQGPGEEHARGLRIVHDQRPFCAHAPLPAPRSVSLSEV